jgi:hypothetical protein
MPAYRYVSDAILGAVPGSYTSEGKTTSDFESIIGGLSIRAAISKIVTSAIANAAIANDTPYNRTIIELLFDLYHEKKVLANNTDIITVIGSLTRDAVRM